MLATLNHGQQKARAGNAVRVPCGEAGKPAPIVDREFQSRHSSRRRGLRSTPNCRGFDAASAPFFAPRVITLDEIHELRICELTGRQPVFAHTHSCTQHTDGQVSDAAEFHLCRPFVSASSRQMHCDREAQGSVPKTSGALPEVRGVLPTIRGSFQHE